MQPTANSVAFIRETWMVSALCAAAADGGRWMPGGFVGKVDRMTLGDLVTRLDQLDDSMTIYAERNPNWAWDSCAVACVKSEHEELSDEARGLSYFLEVLIAKEVVEDWSTLKGALLPSVP